MLTKTRKKAARKKAVRPKTRAVKNVADSYNRFKFHDGKFYTGMGVGRSHKWYYDKGEWHETKITPDLWRISYAVTKRRAGKAPKGSGAAVGTGYHWYILAHQNVTKLNADDYSTSLTGLKYKLAHKRAADNKWSAGTPTQRKHLIQFLQEWIRQLQTEIIKLEFEFKGTVFEGEAIPLPETCVDGVCTQLDITLNNEHVGIIRHLKSGWKMEQAKDQKFVNAIGDAINRHYGIDE
jgi:hypothetical protein